MHNIVITTFVLVQEPFNKLNPRAQVTHYKFEGPRQVKQDASQSSHLVDVVLPYEFGR